MDRQTIVALVPRALESPWLRLRGLHLHVSRLRPTPEAFELAARLIATCIAELHDRYGWQPELLDFGGGYPHERDPESGARVRQPPRRHARGVRRGGHLDVARGARGALARRAAPPARAGPAARQQRDRPAHPRRRRQAPADREARRGPTSTRARTTARASRSRATTTRSSTRRRDAKPATRRSASSARPA